MILENVPPVGFWHAHREHPLRAPAPQDVPLPACVTSVLNYLGQGLGVYEFYQALPAVHPDHPGGHGRVDRLFALLMGTTAAAFRLSWKPGWHGDNVATWLVSDDPAEVFRRAFASVGREQLYVGSCGGDAGTGGDGGDIRAAIVAAIDAGRPAIAHGVVGPPEECVITGYEDGGEVLVGWSFFREFPEFAAGVELRPDGQFRKRRWQPETSGVMVVGEPVPVPPLPQRCRDALHWAVQVMRSPVRYGDRANGIAAFDAWREHILRDDEVAAASDEDVRLRFHVHSDAADVIAEGRWYAHVFCRLAAEADPSWAPELWQAAACFDAEHTLMWELWKVQGSMGHDPAAAQRFAAPELRRACAAIIARVRDLDARAADHIERALRA